MLIGTSGTGVISVSAACVGCTACGRFTEHRINPHFEGARPLAIRFVPDGLPALLELCEKARR